MLLEAPELPSLDLTIAGPALMLPLRVTSACAAGAIKAPPTANAITVLFIPSPYRGFLDSNLDAGHWVALLWVSLLLSLARSEHLPLLREDGRIVRNTTVTCNIFCYQLDRDVTFLQHYMPLFQ